jgi:O-acetyl-ADP-ribose deacetylase (regulator of RNase III)
VAFPAVSAGIYGWPVRSAAQTAVEAVATATSAVEEARFVLFVDDVYQAFLDAVRAHGH